MISEWFIGIASGIVDWFMGGIPADDGVITGWSVTAQNTIGPILSGAGALGAWLPWATLGVCFTAVVGMYIALFFLKAARNLFSHVPIIGGNG